MLVKHVFVIRTLWGASAFSYGIAKYFCSWTFETLQSIILAPKTQKVWRNLPSSLTTWVWSLEYIYVCVYVCKCVCIYILHAAIYGKCSGVSLSKFSSCPVCSCQGVCQPAFWCAENWLPIKVNPTRRGQASKASERNLILLSSPSAWPASCSWVFEVYGSPGTQQDTKHY